MDSALLQTLIYFLVGGLITVFSRRQGSTSVFEQRLNGNGKKTSTAEVEILRVHTEAMQNDRIGSIERWRNVTDERFLNFEKRYFEDRARDEARWKAAEESMRHLEEINRLTLAQLKELRDCCADSKAEPTDISAAESEAA